jgi:methyl-accepting chemotaxis protein
LIEGNSEKIAKRLIGRTEMDDALKRLDKLTQEEARMATAQNLKVAHAVDKGVKEVADTVVAIDDRVARVDDQVAAVNDRVASVDNTVKGVDDRVKDVDDRVKGVDDRVKVVDNKVAEVIVGA